MSIEAHASEHFLYIIAVSQEGRLRSPVKVGITANPRARLRTIQTGSAAPLDFVWVFALPTIDVARSIERAFHRALEHARLTGEWFDMDPERALRLLCVTIQIQCLRAFRDQDIDLFHEALEDTGVPKALASIGFRPCDLRGVL